jgi:AraC family transcriptional regulator
MLDQSLARPSLRIDPGLRLAPRLSEFRAPPGPITVPAAPDHRLRLYKGAPSRGTCGRQSFVTRRGDLDLVPAGLAEEWCGEENTEALLVSLPSALVQRAAAELGRNEHTAIVARCLFRDERIEHIAWALDAEHNAGSPAGPLYTESLGLALAFHLLGAYASADSAPTARALSPNERQRVTRYIEDHIDQNLTLSTLAATLGMGPSHFKALFRRSLGLPVHEYVIQRRVERARTLLLQARLPAAEIALATGFSHQSHMARCMRRILGITPSALVRNAQA